MERIRIGKAQVEASGRYFLEKKIANLQAQNENLVERLRKDGVHETWCFIEDDNGHVTPDCSCGLDRLLEEGK